MVSTGCSSFDELLGGGFPTKAISLIYGEAETGKTTLAIQCAVNCARMGYKSLVIDADGNFSMKRLSQIAYNDYEGASSYIILTRPTIFEEQVRAIEHIDKYITGKFGLVIVDTITSLYRVELESPEETFVLNRELNRQVAFLTQIAKTLNLAIILTSQVRSVFLEGQVKVEPVATRVLKYWSDIVINLEKTGQTRIIKVILEKGQKRKRSKSCYVKIERKGICDYGR